VTENDGQPHFGGGEMVVAHGMSRRGQLSKERHQANQTEQLMIGRGTQFGAGGVGLRPSAGEATGALVRPLGAFERLYHRYQQKNAMHFCVVAELADDLDPAALDAAILAVQHRHPLLNVYVDDYPQIGLGLYRPATVSPIPVTVVDAGTDHTWRDLVAGELARPFDTCTAPMIRVVLLRPGPSNPAAIIVTAHHTVADGLSSRSILRDLFSAPQRPRTAGAACPGPHRRT
jgi:hypothetical protein